MKTTKDAYYFSHDSNAKDDPKCVMLIEQMGLEGYGIFWVLVETLRDQPDYQYPMALLPALARRYNTTTAKMRTVVEKYQLFTITEDGQFFFSHSLNCRMLKASEKREKLRKNALKRWHGDDANAMQLQSNSNADLMPLKERKVKEKKVKESIEKNAPDKPAHRSQNFVPPTAEEVRAYCTERKNSVDPDRFVDFYAMKGWLVGKSKMKDWRAAVRTWEKRDESARAAPTPDISDPHSYREEELPEWARKPVKS